MFFTRGNQSDRMHPTQNYLADLIAGSWMYGMAWLHNTLEEKAKWGYLDSILIGRVISTSVI